MGLRSRKIGDHTRIEEPADIIWRPEMWSTIHGQRVLAQAAKFRDVSDAVITETPQIQQEVE